MQNTQTPAWNEEKMMGDLLLSQKYLTEVYNAFACETATPAVRNALCSILQDEHRIQEEIFHEMSSRGWYQTQKAEDQKLNAAKQKFESHACV